MIWDVINSGVSGLIVAVMTIATLRAQISSLSSELKEFKMNTRNELQLIHERMWDGKNRRGANYVESTERT